MLNGVGGSGNGITPMLAIGDRDITLSEAFKAGIAAFTAKRVGKEVLEERVGICGTCEFARSTVDGQMFCGICSCNLSADPKAIINMAALEENLPAYGCAHPDRADGKGWRR